MPTHPLPFLAFTALTCSLAFQPTGKSPSLGGQPKSPGPSLTPTQPGKQPSAAPAAAPASKRDDSAAESLGWKLGVQAWTFRDRSTEEAIETARSLGIRYMQLYPGQVINHARPDVKVGNDLAPADRDALKKKLADAGITALSYGVTGFTNNEADARKTFEFAKAMGFETIAAEPDEDAWAVVEKLADEFDIRVACHNHPKPSRYWKPETVLASLKGRSKRLGACADTGHWKRSGLDPASGLNTLRGFVLELHFKDIADDKDRPWGTGHCDAHGMLKVLQSHGFRGCIFIEYEDGAGPELDANVGRCVEFLDRVAAETVKSPRKK